MGSISQIDAEEIMFCDGCGATVQPGQHFAAGSFISRPWMQWNWIGFFSLSIIHLHNSKTSGRSHASPYGRSKLDRPSALLLGDMQPPARCFLP